MQEKLNELDGKEWTKYSISIWDVVKSPEEMKLKHPAMFPEELVRRLIKIYTKEGEVVLDPFMGSGTIVLAARNLNRKGIGFELCEEFFSLAKKRLRYLDTQLEAFSSEGEKTAFASPEIYLEDARNILKYVKTNSVDLVVTSPPYWDIHRQKRTADYKEIRPYSELEQDLGNISDYNQFLTALKEIFEQVYMVLKPGKWCIIVIMDIRKKDKFYPLHMDMTRVMQEIGFELDDIIIWDRRLEYSNLRPLGYPYVFRVNKIHEYILIFVK
ncbi:MAG: site-specific DNA-methyltransferase [Candidatus Freyarchaeota archaeon]|nr:site-specific DNA-methyltransferase [Candidatus Jordarchaeia archaeon]MBS7270251.1 site-specific DNA-methyltransferase [Candidatus Jordarchaeia archaeon]MBS7280584.1 site-specific DNA-methyltransferase [Candidatus Jordarchaeia archaeon]